MSHNNTGPAEGTTANELEDEETREFSRRGFVKVAVGGAGLAYAGAIGFPIYKYLSTPVEKSAELAAVKEVVLPNADKMPKGTAIIFKFGVRPSLLIHHLDDTWVAMSAVCTHMGCTVAYNAAASQIECHCHGGKYDPHTGDNISGPPPRPLKKFDVVIGNGSVTVRRA
jgi:cytochrome b6-f complex iron-sulfur subunit